MAATEAAAAGVHWTFAPMVDIARDARWGRIMEGAGEDPYLGAQVAAARVRGFQGTDLAATDTIAACAKHYAAYGFAEAGRDYNTVDISEHTLRNVVLPPFQAAVEAGVATLMNSFNEIGGDPGDGERRTCSARSSRGSGASTGFVVSDWGSIGEMVPHGVRGGPRARPPGWRSRPGSDMDMESRRLRGAPRRAGEVGAGRREAWSTTRCGASCGSSSSSASSTTPTATPTPARERGVARQRRRTGRRPVTWPASRSCC